MDDSDQLAVQPSFSGAAAGERQGSGGKTSLLISTNSSAMFLIWVLMSKQAVHSAVSKEARQDRSYFT